MVGLLILHGFTGSLDTVRALVPLAEKLGLPYRMPVLRGHGTQYMDLADVKAQDWYDDAEHAMFDLLSEVDEVIIIGLSMGGVLALNLAIQHANKIKGLVLLAPALRFRDPLTMFSPLLKKIFTYWKSPSSFKDKKLEREVCTNYPYFPTAAFDELRQYAKRTVRQLHEVNVPVVTLYTAKDTIVSKQIIDILRRQLATDQKHFVKFFRSGHEMLQDCQATEIILTIEKTLKVWIS